MSNSERFLLVAKKLKEKSGLRKILKAYDRQMETLSTDFTNALPNAIDILACVGGGDILVPYASAQRLSRKNHFKVEDADHETICMPVSREAPNYYKMLEMMKLIMDPVLQTHASSVQEASVMLQQEQRQDQFAPRDEDHQTVHQLYPHDPDLDRDLDIVFFHGLQIKDGRHAWRTTWENSRGECWPRDWLSDDLQRVIISPARVRVLSVSYSAQVTNWLAGGFGEMEESGHNAITEQFIQSLVVAGDWRLGARPFVLVGHSYGGLVIKSLVAQCHSKAIRKNIMQNPHVGETSKAAKEFMRNLKGIEFYAVPHRGTNMANFAKLASKYLNVLRKANFVSTDLTLLSRANVRLSDEFDQAIHGPNVAIFSFMEARGIRWIGKVVMEISAELDGPDASMRLDQTDHFSVCKPKTKRSLGYEIFLMHLKIIFGSLPGLLAPNHGSPVPPDIVSFSGSQNP